MIRDWRRPKGTDITNYTKEVNLFNTDEEILKKNYVEFLQLDGSKNPD
jgi:hypothetical protein